MNKLRVEAYRSGHFEIWQEPKEGTGTPLVASLDYGNAEANAKELVHRWNAYHALLEALKELHEYVELFNIPLVFCAELPEYERIAQKARAAIAAAEGKP